MSAHSAGPDGLDLRDDDYPALNCRAGVFAAILETGHGIDPAPIFPRTVVDSRRIVEPIERGEIAGASMGVFADDVWTELFGLRVVESHPTSPADMVTWLGDALHEHRLVMAAHDGYWDPLADGKYLRRHVRHNSLIYGTAADGDGYRIADRGHRTTMDPAVLWQCMEEETTTFVVLTDAAPFAGDWAVQVAAGAGKFYHAMTATLAPADLARIGVALDADLRSPGDRWQQSHMFFLGIGRSRALFAQALARGGGILTESTDLVGRLQRAAHAWAVVGRWIYKRLVAGRAVDVVGLEARIRSAETADALAAEALAVSCGSALA
jgi:hypothetical protein